jgi:hypothetical protein
VNEHDSTLGDPRRLTEVRHHESECSAPRVASALADA